MISTNHLSIVILAAGKGTRMKSDKAKVLHEVFFQPMLHHVLNAVEPLAPHRTVVIVGHQEEAVRKSLQGFNVTTVRQEKQLGTGHAVLMTENAIPENDGLVMILCGDTPLIQSKSLEAMLQQHIEKNSELTVMTTMLDDPFGYGRIIAKNNCVQSIVEEKEADDKQKEIKEINAGIYLVKRNHLFDALKRLTPDNSQGEFYLTDIIEYSVAKGLEVQKHVNGSAKEILGVNSRVELEEAHCDLQIRRNIEIMQQGVSIHSSSSTSISPLSIIGADSLIMSNAQILGSSIIGSSCIIENGAIIRDCNIGNNVRIGAYCVLKDCSISPNSEIEPFTVMPKE